MFGSIGRCPKCNKYMDRCICKADATPTPASQLSPAPRCKACNGRGLIGFLTSLRCNACDGKGRVAQPSPARSDEVRVAGNTGDGVLIIPARSDLTTAKWSDLPVAKHPPVPALSDMPDTGHEVSTDCRSPEGIATGLIDGMIAVARVLRNVDQSHPAVIAALKDLCSDEDVAALLAERTSSSDTIDGEEFRKALDKYIDARTKLQAGEMAKSFAALVTFIDARRATAGTPAEAGALDALRSIRDLAHFDTSPSAVAYYRKAENALAAIECRDAVELERATAGTTAPAPTQAQAFEFAAEYDEIRGDEGVYTLTSDDKWVLRNFLIELFEDVAGNTATAVPGGLRDDESDPVVLWAEIHRLQCEAKGPDGFATWKDAAVAERIRRVKAEKGDK